MSYWVIFGILMIFSLIVQWRLNSRFKKYSKEFLPSGLTGREIAEKMLRDHGIDDVKVTCIQGRLTDHYNPADKTVNLSEDVYNGSSVSSAAVAAHECGHAVQHATAYRWLTLRSTLVPIVNVGSSLSVWILLVGFILMGIESLFNIGYVISVIAVVLFALSTLFAFITLPVEYNASNRALEWLENTGISNGIEHEHAKDALKWAARTYVMAALVSLANLLYYVAALSRN